MTSKLLEAQVAIVTGADSGIGQAIAIAFGRHGAKVAINYLHDARGAEQTRQQVSGAGASAITVQGDVGRPEDVERLFQQCERQLGTATILVNNAGIDSTGAHVADLTLEAWTRALQINLTGPFLCSRRFVNGLKGRGAPAKIINISSVHEEAPRAGAAEYCASKGGLRNLTRCLALELAEASINVNNIAPGMVLTPMNQEAIDDPKKREEQVRSIPMKRAAEPAEIAELAVFLASPQSAYVTGSTYVIDGGLLQNVGQGA